MRRTIITAALTGIVSLTATAAQAAVLDFNAATPVEYATTPYFEDGFRLDVLAGHYDIWGVGTCNPITNPCTSNYLGVDGSFGESRLRLTRSDGGNFDLVSLLVLNSHGPGGPGTCGTTDCTVASSNSGLTSFLPQGVMNFAGPDWTNLSWVEFFGSFANGPYAEAAIDDINVAPVPIPAALWLLGSTLGVLGGLRRRASA